MQRQQIQLHDHFMRRSTTSPDPLFIDHLATRRHQLAKLITQSLDQLEPEEQKKGHDHAWLARTYPVIAVLAPAMATSIDKVEYPGDPMCLYSALSVAIDQIIQTRDRGFSLELPESSRQHYTYNDLCPQWGMLPSRDYRHQIADSGIRNYTAPLLNTDQTIFDPRVWNQEIKQYFIDQVLLTVRPKVVLISSVSPAHRYAIDIARQVRRYLPETLIVFGGRHMDETMRFADASKSLTLSYSSTLRAIADERIEPVADFIISGDGYFALDLLMKAISVAMDLQHKTTTAQAVIQALDSLSTLMGPIPGKAVLAAVDRSEVHLFPIRGPRFDLALLPSPYRAVGTRARFPIFQTEHGAVARTAHMMITSACPYHCNFCSEGVTTVGQIHRFTHEPIATAVNRVLEYVSYGAEALFFDDSVFWSGNVKQMKEFAQALKQARVDAETFPPHHFPWLQEQGDLARLCQLQWGAQLTAEFLTTLTPHDNILECLTAMKEAGCTYLYIGIESLAATVMKKVHKNLQKADGPSWIEKVRLALTIAQQAGIRVGSSVLFGLDGETKETIEITIEGVGQFIDEGLLYLASPNILTYHPATVITQMHGKEDRLDYHSLDVPNNPPYTYFEEAYPGVVSQELSEEDIWYIHRRAKERWGQVRYTDSLLPTLGEKLPTR